MERFKHNCKLQLKSELYVYYIGHYIIQRVETGRRRENWFILNELSE